MRVRRLDESGDLVTRGKMFLEGREAIAQTVVTRLRLFLGEYFRDITDGTPWFQQILGKFENLNAVEAILRNRIARTQGVVRLLSFDMQYDFDARTVSVQAQILTEYGEQEVLYSSAPEPEQPTSYKVSAQNESIFLRDGQAGVGLTYQGRPIDTVIRVSDARINSVPLINMSPDRYVMFDFTRGGQLDPRITFTSGERTYIEGGVLKTAPANTPVFEDGAWRLRPQETNLLPGDVAEADWLKLRVTTGAITTIAGYSLREITVANENGNGSYVSRPLVSLPLGRVTYRAVVKQESPGWCMITMRDPDATPSPAVTVWFNLSTGVVGNAFSVNGLTLLDPPTATQMKDGAWLLEIQFDTTVTYLRAMVFGKVSGNGDLGSIGLLGEKWWVGGLQVNEGDPIPYIPTTTSQVTVPADSALIQGSAFSEVFNPSEGAIVFGLDKRVPDISRAVRMDDGTNTNQLYVAMRPDGCVFQVWKGGSATQTITFWTDLSSGQHKAAVAWDSTGIAVGLDGNVHATKLDPANYDLSTLVRAVLTASGTPIWRTGLTIFSRRPSDAEMEALTSTPASGLYSIRKNTALIAPTARDGDVFEWSGEAWMRN